MAAMGPRSAYNVVIILVLLAALAFGIWMSLDMVKDALLGPG